MFLEKSFLFSSVLGQGVFMGEEETKGDGQGHQVTPWHGSRGGHAWWSSGGYGPPLWLPFGLRLRVGE